MILATTRKVKRTCFCVGGGSPDSSILSERFREHLRQELGLVAG